MSDVDKKVNIIKNLLDRLSTNLDLLDFESFDTLFPSIVSGIKEVHQLRGELVGEFGIERLQIYETDLFQRAKLIERKFDNIIGIFTREEKKLEKELLSYMSKKKITNYLRY
ncbi:MAG: hypothetical protein ACYC4T_02930 [Melioribacteraceae bacterium]